MTEPEPERTGVEEDVPVELGEYLAAGLELHARIIEEAGKPGVDIIFEPTIRDREIPEGIAEFNRVIESLCRTTVVNFPDSRTLARFYREVKKDGEQNRCWYRITVTAQVGADDTITQHIADVIDPALLRADPHVRFRARQLRGMIQRGMGEE